MADAPTDDAVQHSVADGVATVTLNRPDVRNALTADVQAGLRDALDAIEADEDVRCVVLAGRGGAFCAGGDVGAMRERQEGESTPAEGAARIERTVHRTVKRVARFPLPTVAAVDGPAFGAGATLALACDCQVASTDARIGWGFRRVGLAVDSGTSYFLPRVVGSNVAKELVFTGELLDAERAADLGLFNRVVPAGEFEAALDAFVEPIASGPTVALRASKRLLDAGLETSLDGALHNEATAQGTVYDTHDHREGVAAFVEGRDPSFEGH